MQQKGASSATTRNPVTLKKTIIWVFSSIQKMVDLIFGIDGQWTHTVFYFSTMFISTTNAKNLFSELFDQHFDQTADPTGGRE